MTAKKTSKTAKKAEPKTSPVVDNTKLLETLDLCDALVREVDNLMGSKLPPAQIGKVLGDIMSGFSDRVEDTRKQIN